MDVLVDGVSQGRANHPGWADPVGAWSMNLNLAAGSHTLTVNAVHPSHQYTATASSTFTVAQSQGGNVTSAYDTDGDVTIRTWDSGLTQTLTWDAFGRLIKVAQRDSANNGYDWSAVYDGLGRRLKTTQQTVTANAASGSATVTTSIYDPQVEFMEIGVAVNGAKAWKVYGPDLNGRFGSLQGTGGLEATIVDAGGATKGVINDQFGNGVASVSGGSISWFATRVGAYGPLPGSPVETLSDITRVAEATAWRSRRIDPTGFIYLGARYYEPTSGRFLSADPLGHGASMSLYDFVNGDPINYFDPDGRGKDPNKTKVDCGALKADINSMRGVLNQSLNAMNRGRSFLVMSRADFIAQKTNSPINPADLVSTAADSLSVAGAMLLPWGSKTEEAGAIIGGVANITNTSLAAYSYSHKNYGAALMYGTAAATDLMSVASNTLPILKVVTVPVDIGKGILGGIMIAIDQANILIEHAEAEAQYGNEFDRLRAIESRIRDAISAKEALYNENCG